MTMILSSAYRAILAEPRIKASSTEDYSGASSRSDYIGGGDTMTPYPPPLRMHPYGDFYFLNKYSYIYIFIYIWNVQTHLKESVSLASVDPSNYQTVDYRAGDFTRCLMISTRAALTQEQLFALFDIIPGMEYCELQRDAYGMSKGQ